MERKIKTKREYTLGLNCMYFFFQLRLILFSLIINNISLITNNKKDLLNNNNNKYTNIRYLLTLRGFTK